MMKRVLTSAQNLRKQKQENRQYRNLKTKQVRVDARDPLIGEREQSKFIFFSNEDLYGAHADEASALEQQISVRKKVIPQNSQLYCSHKTTEKCKGNQHQNQSINNPTITKQWSRNLNIKSEIELKSTEKVSQLINMKVANQKLEGWITQNSSSHHFLVDQCGNVCQIQYEQDFKKFKTIQSTPDQKIQSRPLSRSSKNKQFETQNFLKEIKLKYAKALKFRENQLKTSKSKDKCLAQQDPILIEDDEIEKIEENLSNSNHFVKYSQRKTFLNLKRITPDANQNIGSSRNFTRVDANRWDNLDQRINHDCLIPRPSSKKRNRMPSDLSASLSNEKNLSKSINNISQNFRQKTIDPAELSSRKIQKQLNSDQKKLAQYVGYKKSKKQKQAENTKKDLIQSVSSNLLGPASNNHSNLLFKNNRPAAQSSKRNTLVKIKLKYLKSLKYGHHSNLSNIEPRNLQNAKIVQPKINSYRTLNTEVSVSNLTNKNSPKSLTHRGPEPKTSRKKYEQFESLKKLLQKEEREPAYLLCQNQMPNTAHIEYA